MPGTSFLSVAFCPWICIYSDTKLIAKIKSYGMFFVCICFVLAFCFFWCVLSSYFKMLWIHFCWFLCCPVVSFSSAWWVEFANVLAIIELNPSCLQVSLWLFWILLSQTCYFGHCHWHVSANIFRFLQSVTWGWCDMYFNSGCWKVWPTCQIWQLGLAFRVNHKSVTASQSQSEHCKEEKTHHGL